MEALKPTLKRHQDLVQQLQVLENDLISIISQSENEQLNGTFLAWQAKREECNEMFLEIVGDVNEKVSAIKRVWKMSVEGKCETSDDPYKYRVRIKNDPKDYQEALKFACDYCYEKNLKLEYVFLETKEYFDVPAVQK